MLNNINPSGRVKELADQRGVTMYAVSQETGISQSTLSRFVAGKGNISRRNLKILSDYFHVGLEWLITGEGSRYLDSTTERTKLSARTRIIQYLASKEIPIKEFAKSIKSSIEYWNDSDNDYTIPIHAINKALKSLPELDPVWVFTGEGEMLKPVVSPAINYERKGSPYYDIDFIGGFDLVLNNQTINPEYYIDFEPYNKPGVMWCNITGHSMEPAINHGDIIAIKEVQDWESYISFGEIYAIVTKNQMRTVKKIRKGNTTERYRLVPINTVDYDEQEIEKDKISKVFEVLGCMKRF